MASKIKSVTAINLQGTNSYFVGRIYNDSLLLDMIKDESMEYPNSITIIYRGYTVTGDIVFELINAPVDVEYERA